MRWTPNTAPGYIITYIDGRVEQRRSIPQEEASARIEYKQRADHLTPVLLRLEEDHEEDAGEQQSDSELHPEAEQDAEDSGEGRLSEYVVADGFEVQRRVRVLRLLLHEHRHVFAVERQLVFVCRLLRGVYLGRVDASFESDAEDDTDDDDQTEDYCTAHDRIDLHRSRCFLQVVEAGEYLRAVRILEDHIVGEVNRSLLATPSERLRHLPQRQTLLQVQAVPATELFVDWQLRVAPRLSDARREQRLPHRSHFDV